MVRFRVRAGAESWASVIVRLWLRPGLGLGLNLGLGLPLMLGLGLGLGLVLG